MTLDEEWELMKQVADSQNAAIDAALDEHFKGKRPPPKQNTMFTGAFGHYNGIKITRIPPK